MAKITWNEANVAVLTDAVAGMDVVSQDTVAQLAEQLGTTTRSVSSKLRNLDFEVEKVGAKQSAWTEAEENALSALVTGNSGAMTYAEIAATFENGKFNAKQVQGKILSMELFSHVRKSEPKAAPRTYTEAEENKFVELVNDGASIETLMEAFGRSNASIRGKALSLMRAGQIDAIPTQEKSNAKEVKDVLEGLDVANMTVAEIAEASDKSERGIKSTLSRRGITCADYDGAAKRAKLDAKA